MAKAIGEIAAGVALIATAILIPGGGALLMGGASPLVVALFSAGASMALAGGLEGIADLIGSNPGTAISTTSPVGPWNIIYGNVKVGGIKIFQESNSNTGGGSTSNDKQLHRVYAIASHPCDIASGFQLRIDGKQVLLTPNGDGWSSYSPTQLYPSIVSISRNSGLVTMVLASGIANADGTTLLVHDVADNTFNGAWIVTQPNPLDDTTFTYPCGGANATTSGGYAKTTYSDYKDKIYVEWLDGNHTATFATLLNAGTTWGPNDLCLGRTMVYVQLGYDETVFPSDIPVLSFIINGKNDIYDPRTGTAGYTDNPALCIADYLATPATRGGFGLSIGTNIPTAQLTAAANLCDEAVPLAGGGTTPRYTCNTNVMLTQTRGTILQNLLGSCAGRISYQGGTYNIFPGAWVTPTLSLTDADLIGPIQWSGASIRDICNAVKGTFTSPENNYQQSDYPAYMQDTLHGYSSDQYLIADNGERVFTEMNTPCTNSSAIAQRLAKIAMMRTRFPDALTIRVSMKAYQAVALDVIELTHPRYSWAAKYFEVLKSTFVVDKSNGAPCLGVELKLKATDPSIYNWSTSEQLTPQGWAQPSNVGIQVVSMVEQLTLYSGPGATIGGVTYPNTVATGADGIKRNSLFVNWVSPNDAFVTSGGQIEVQYQLAGASAWTEVGKFHGSTTSCFIAGVSDAASYNVQVRCINTAGVPSDWRQAGPDTVSSVTSSISASIVSGLSGVATSGVISAGAITSGTLSSAVLPTALARLNAGAVTGATVVPGAAAQVGTGAAASCTGSGLTGKITLTTGTGTLAAGVIATLTFPAAFPTAPNGVVAVNGTAIHDLEWSTTTNTLALSVTAALAPSTTYTIGYSLS